MLQARHGPTAPCLAPLFPWLACGEARYNLVVILVLVHAARADLVGSRQLQASKAPGQSLLTNSNELVPRQSTLTAIQTLPAHNVLYIGTIAE